MITGINKNTLKEAMCTMSLSGIGLCLLDDMFFDNKSDGMVYVDSQRKVEKFILIQRRKSKWIH